MYHNFCMVTAFSLLLNLWTFQTQKWRKTQKKEENLNFLFRFSWWTIQDSNLWPPARQADALPAAPIVHALSARGILTDGAALVKSFFAFQKIILTLCSVCRIICKLTTEQPFDSWANVEMSRSWSSAHDWKSCKGQKLFESSNLSISAMKKNPPPSGGGFFFISYRRDSKRARAKREKQAGSLFRCPCACRRGARAGRISPSPP